MTIRPNSLADIVLHLCHRHREQAALMRTELDLSLAVWQAQRKQSGGQKIDLAAVYEKYRKAAWPPSGAAPPVDRASHEMVQKHWGAIEQQVQADFEGLDKDE